MGREGPQFLFRRKSSRLFPTEGERRYLHGYRRGAPLSAKGEGIDPAEGVVSGSTDRARTPRGPDVVSFRRPSNWDDFRPAVS